jgi:hypothetical protein
VILVATSMRVDHLSVGARVGEIALGNLRRCCAAAVDA